MGSIISLGIGNFEIDWSKNSYFRNHSKLFFRDDIKLIPYYYLEDEETITDKKELGYARTLGATVNRLDLLGYTIPNCEAQYNQMVREPVYLDYYSPISFKIFSRALSLVNVNRISLPDDPSNYDFGEYVVENILKDPEFVTIDKEFLSLKKKDGEFYENLDPYIILRLLAQNFDNLDKDIAWRYLDVVENEWVQESELYEGLTNTDRYLIVTEGSTDTKILKKTLPMIEPDVVDFFDFIDMSENYPFTGTGNVVNFCKGLVQIRVQNQILIILDNDTAGREAYIQIQQLGLPRNMHVTLLPTLKDFSKVLTVGPEGASIQDINGRAVAIECFLDYQNILDEKPMIRWTSYNKSLDAYQGEMIRKRDCIRYFFEHAGNNSNYDLTKLRQLWAHILDCCKTMKPHPTLNS